MILPQSDQERLDEDARKLLEAYERGQHTSLLAEVDEIAKRQPLSASLLGLAANSLIALDRFGEAVTAVQGALEREPRWSWLYITLSRAEAGAANWAKAVEAAQVAVQITPGEPAYLATLARSLRESGQVPQAIKAAREALLLDPAHAEALNELGLALEASGDEQGALAQFREAQRLHPTEPQAYLNTGMLHRRAGRVRESRSAFQEALRHNPGNEEAEDRLAESLSGSSAVRGAVMHLLTLSRLTLVGWGIIAFLYYLVFRLLEFVWRFFAFMLPVGQGLLIITLVWLVGGAILGWLLRKSLLRLA